MKKYEMITLENAVFIPLETLVHDYNDAIETIWCLQQKLKEQMTENEQLWKAYEVSQPALWINFPI